MEIADVASVKRWQWLLAGALVGAALWGANRWQASDLARFGDAMNDPLRFEQALTAEVAGVPAFKDVSVRRETLSDGAGSSRTVHVVTGKFCDGRLDASDGKYHWRPTVFVAPIPYRPATYLLDVVGMDEAIRFEAIENPTVVDLLKVLKQAKGVQYHYAWWNDYPLLTWFGGSLVLIGVVWPTVVNLLVYRSFFRPREEKGVDLSRISAASAAAAGQELSEEELERLRRLEAELERGLAAGAAPGPADSPAEAAERPPVPLTVEPLAPVAAAAGDPTEFGAEPDDYYPTERRRGKAGGAAAGDNGLGSTH